MARDKFISQREIKSSSIKQEKTDNLLESISHNETFEPSSSSISSDKPRRSKRNRKDVIYKSVAKKPIFKNKYKSEQSFRQHFYLSHNELKWLWRCRVCQARFSSIIEYATHSIVDKHENHLNEERYSCYICANESDNPMYRGQHPCALCDKVCGSLNNLLKHRRASHKQEQESSALVEGAVIISCDFCDQLFHRKTDLELHKRYDHTGETRPCGICGCATTNLYYHIKTHHLTNGGARFACSQCPMTFQHAYSLGRHERRRHTGEAVFRCDLCGYGAPDAYWMAKHQSAHDRNVDKDGNYLPLPPHEMTDARRAGVWHLKDRLADAATGPDEDEGRCDRCEEDKSRRLTEIETNSKATDTFDLKYFIRPDYY